MGLFLFNTLSKEKEEFAAINTRKISVYTCGPTVYNYAHIGNLRAYIFADTLVRILRYNYGADKVRWAMNITDVDDKTIRDSQVKYPDMEPMAALKKFTEEFERFFWEDIMSLNIVLPDVIPHAAGDKYVEAQQRLVAKIYKSGYGYIKDGSVYFNVSKYARDHRYGELINLDMDGFRAGTRVDADEYDKENIQDFVLWKGWKEGEPSWDFELDGQSLPGRPGWHIECSAMGESELGTPFDIHTGGVDLKFPHHENEIAQSVVGYGVDRPVNYWLHNEFLLVDGVKMSKRYNNFHTLRDLTAKGFKPLAYRYQCLQTHYGKQMNFTLAGLQAAEEGLNHLYNQIRELRTSSTGHFILNDNINAAYIDADFQNKFLTAVNDDLNLPQALAVVQEVLKSKLEPDRKLATVMDFDRVLGLRLEEADGQMTLPADVANLAQARRQARENKQFAESDRLRAEIEKLGFVVEDTKGGQRVYKK